MRLVRPLAQIPRPSLNLGGGRLARGWQSPANSATSGEAKKHRIGVLALSKREQNKKDKQTRILAAARDAFRTHGFDGATLKQVAADAGVGHGTLFLYAPTKEALLVQVFKAELGKLIIQSFSDMPKADIRTQLRHMFGVFIEQHARDPELYRPFLREVMAVSGPHISEVKAFVQDWRGRIADLLAAARDRGEVPADRDIDLLATALLDLFSTGQRRWITGDISRAELERYIDTISDLMLR